MPWPAGFMEIKVALKQQQVDGYTARKCTLTSGNFVLGAPVSDYWKFSYNGPDSVALSLQFKPQIVSSFYLYPRSTFGFTDEAAHNDAQLIQYLQRIAQNAESEEVTKVVFKRTDKFEVCIFPGIDVNDRATYADKVGRIGDAADLVGHHYYECRYTKVLNETNISGAIVFIPLAQSMLLGLQFEAERRDFENYFNLLKSYLKLFYVAQHGNGQTLIGDLPASEQQDPTDAAHFELSL